MFGLNRALYWHFCVVHEHYTNQSGTMLSGGELRNFPRFMMV